MPLLNPLYQTFKKNLINLKQGFVVMISKEINLPLLFDKISYFKPDYSKELETIWEQPQIFDNYHLT